MAATWECPPLSMIYLPLKDTSKANFQPLKALIADCYGENPESFSEELRQLEQLRESSIKPVRDYQGCNVLRRYYAQLHLLSARFPEDSAKMQVQFAWKDAFSSADYKQDGIQLELSSVLYNIGALHSQVGSKDGRHSEQDMKEALTHFQCAAGAFQYFYDNLASSGCSDMSPQLIEMYKTLMLAQAQECTVEKSLKGLSRVKNLNISKITMKVAQYYQFVLSVLESAAGAVVVKKHKDWAKNLQIKSTLYTAIAHLYQANALEEQGNYGYMIAFQQLSLQKIQSVGKLPRGTPDVFKDAVKNFTEYISQKLDTSLNQNEQVFHELVPSLDSLEPAPGVELVKPIVFQPMDRKTAGTDIFSRLVPMSAYEAASVYSEEKAKILRSVTSSVEEKDEELEGFLLSLNMDEIDQAKAENPTLPAELLKQHELLLSKHQVMEDIQLKIQELKNLSETVQQQLDSIAQKRLENEQEDKDYQERYGPKPESQVCSSIWKEHQSLMKYHKQASNSNNELFSAFEKHKANLLLLAGTKNALVGAMPRMSLNDVNKDFDKDRWKELMHKVEEMKQQRMLLTRQLREQIDNDDITRAIIGELSTNRDALFDEYLHKHRSVADIIRQNLTAQDNILRAVTEFNARQAQMRQAYHQMMKRREEWCVSLAKSAGCYGFLENKISEGLEFYRKLAESVYRLFKRCQEVCATRLREKQAMEKKIVSTCVDRNASPMPTHPPAGVVNQTNSPYPFTPDNDVHSNAEFDGVQEISLSENVTDASDDVQMMIMKMKQRQDEQKASIGTTPTENVTPTPVEKSDASLLLTNEINDEALPMPLVPEDAGGSSSNPPHTPLTVTSIASTVSSSVHTPISSIIPVLDSGPSNHVPDIMIPVTDSGSTVAPPTMDGNVSSPTDAISSTGLTFSTNTIPHTEQVLSPVDESTCPVSLSKPTAPPPPPRPEKPLHLQGVPTTNMVQGVSVPSKENEESHSVPVESTAMPLYAETEQGTTIQSVGVNDSSIKPVTFDKDSNLADFHELTTADSTADSIESGFTPSMSVLPQSLPSLMGTPINSIDTQVQVLGPPPLSVTTLAKEASVGLAESPLTSTSLHLENMIVSQQNMIQNQMSQLNEQQEQLKSQTSVIDELRKELHSLKTRQSEQDKEKTASSTNQAMLMKLLQQQQGLFTQQQSHLDKINKEGEARRQQMTELEMKLRDALAQEQFQNQNLQSQLAQQSKDLQHLHQQLQTVTQQLQGIQGQAQQYLVQIQERDKALSNYRDEHRRIVDGMESQFKHRMQQLTQQLQEIQATRGGGVIPPPARALLQAPLQPQQQFIQPLPQPSSTTQTQFSNIAQDIATDKRKENNPSSRQQGGLMDSVNALSAVAGIHPKVQSSDPGITTQPVRAMMSYPPDQNQNPVISGLNQPQGQYHPAGSNLPPKPVGQNPLTDQNLPVGHAAPIRPTAGHSAAVGPTLPVGHTPPIGRTLPIGQGPHVRHTPSVGHTPSISHTPLTGQTPPNVSTGQNQPSTKQNISQNLPSAHLFQQTNTSHFVSQRGNPLPESGVSPNQVTKTQAALQPHSYHESIASAESGPSPNHPRPVPGPPGGRPTGPMVPSRPIPMPANHNSPVGVRPNPISMGPRGNMQQQPAMWQNLAMQQLPGSQPQPSYNIHSPPVPDQMRYHGGLQPMSQLATNMPQNNPQNLPGSKQH